MVLPEFSFCILSSLILSKVNLALLVLWQTISQVTNWTVEFSMQTLMNGLSYVLMGDIVSWLDNKTRLCEICLVGCLLVVLAMYFESCFNVFTQEDKSKFTFGYRRNNGPSIWKEHYENALGTKQSPINIVLSKVVRCSCGPLQWSNFGTLPDCMFMHNDGYSVTIDGKWMCGKPTLTGTPLENDCYIFNRLYFHWGPTDTEGSEHTLDYERFPLELHMIFLKAGFTNPMDAHYEQCRNGIVIVVFLFEITPVDNPGFLTIITDNLHKVKRPKSVCQIQPFSLNDIYPEFQHDYYKYDGSITQPPCSEIVTYLIQGETIAVSKRQMSKFRKLLALDGKPMENNSRPVQKINSRTVYYYTS